MATITMLAKLRAEIKHKGEWFVSSCPDLDIHSQGKTETEAMNNLKEAISLFFITTFERGTLETALKECGFKMHLGEQSAPPREDEKNTIQVPIPLLLDRNGYRAECPV